MLSYNIQSSKMSFLVIDHVSTEVECRGSGKIPSTTHHMIM